ncbi:MAG: hypothetical protein IJF87_11670 [Erysipelotrichaceae bacterium]|nr:hypothetical protein [Erysipelotrichaceae bacterium]
MTKNKTWLLIFAAVTLLTGIAVCSITTYIDPYIHFHKPHIDKFYYVLNNQRSQNNGIIRHFDYDAVITGTSMVENFRTTETDTIFGCHSIKVPYSGGSFKEINDILKTAFQKNPDMKCIIRGLDQTKILDDKDAMRFDLGEYPLYLYDNNPFNDIEYLMNRDVLYTRIWDMVKKARDGESAGITSFDSYSNWMKKYTFGNEAVLKTVFEDSSNTFIDTEIQKHLSDKEREMIKENIKQNVTDLADAYPDTIFYYFFTPYSAAWWGKLKQEGTLLKQIEIEEYALSIILQHDNIRMFGWNRFDLLDDLNNYKDDLHYGEWVNSWILSEMKKDSGRLTPDNYEEYINELRYHYLEFDYNALFEQTDYEGDFYAAGLLNKEISETDPLVFDQQFLSQIEIKNADIITNQYDGKSGIECYGMTDRKNDFPDTVEEAAWNGNYCGLEITIDVSDYRALCFDGRKTSSCGQPSVFVYDASGKLLSSFTVAGKDLDNKWHQYSINLGKVNGEVRIVMSGSNFDDSEENGQAYVFSNIILY